MLETWNYRQDIRDDTDALIDLEVEALDGGIGNIVEESAEADSSHFVVDTGFWIFGTKRLIPAGAVDRVDLVDGKVYINMTKEQVKNSPEFNPPEDDYPDNGHYQPYMEYYAGYPWM